MEMMPYSGWLGIQAAELRIEPLGTTCEKHRVVPALGYEPTAVSATCGCEGFVIRPRSMEERKEIAVMQQKITDDAAIRQAQYVLRTRGFPVDLIQSLAIDR